MLTWLLIAVQAEFNSIMYNNTWQAGAVWWPRPGVEHFAGELWTRAFVTTSDFPTLQLPLAPERNQLARSHRMRRAAQSPR